MKVLLGGLWDDAMMQKELEGVKRNKAVFVRSANELKGMGYKPNAYKYHTIEGVAKCLQVSSCLVVQTHYRIRIHNPIHICRSRIGLRI